MKSATVARVPLKFPALMLAPSIDALMAPIRMSILASGSLVCARASAKLIAPPPILEAGCLAEIFEGGAVKSQRFAEAYAAVAKRHGCAFLDAGAVIVSSPLDGVHFDAEEHGKLGRAVAAALTKMRKEQL